MAMSLHTSQLCFYTGHGLLRPFPKKKTNAFVPAGRADGRIDPVLRVVSPVETAESNFALNLRNQFRKRLFRFLI